MLKNTSMGLDISAVSELERVELPEGVEPFSDAYYDWEENQGGHVWFFNTPSVFPEQAEGVDDGAYISDGASHGFRAGSYTGYGMWRDELSHAAGYFGGSSDVWAKVDGGGYKGRPFEELINFSDADGFIGPVVSKKLYQDFVDNEKNIMSTIDKWVLMKGHPDHTPSLLEQRKDDKFDQSEGDYTLDDVRWFRLKYKDWKEAFRIASNNGAVIFH